MAAEATEGLGEPGARLPELQQVRHAVIALPVPLDVVEVGVELLLHPDAEDGIPVIRLPLLALVDLVHHGPAPLNVRHPLARANRRQRGGGRIHVVIDPVNALA